MKKGNQSDQGMTLVVAMVMSTIMTITVAALAQILSQASRQTVYFQSTNQAFTLAEKGINNAISDLANVPDDKLVDKSTHTETNPEGTWCVQHCYPRDKPFISIHYIVSEGRTKTRGQENIVRLHAYVKVSNVGEYFAATKSKLMINQGVDLSNGRIYSPQLIFQTNGSGVTYVKTAEYDNQVTPDVNIGIPEDYTDDTWVDSSNSSLIQVVDSPSAAKVPTKLMTPLLFPEVFDSDLLYWQVKAGPHVDVVPRGGNGVCEFTGDIFPPGYSGTQNALDAYPGHTTSEAHIYYCSGDIKIRGAVHGQVLFVSKQNIRITGNLVKPVPDSTCPYGSGDTSLPPGSKDHQAILISQKNITIDNGAWLGPVLGPHQVTGAGGIEFEYIRALVMAPNATFSSISYNDETIHSKLGIDFKGTLVLSEISSSPPNNFPTVFKAGGVYSYDDSFSNNPPPFLPALAQLLYMIEENVSSGNLY